MTISSPPFSTNSEQGIITPTKPPELRVLVKNGLDLRELLEKYPPLSDTPLKEI